jgi:hypothetical protein
MHRHRSGAQQWAPTVRRGERPSEIFGWVRLRPGDDRGGQARQVETSTMAGTAPRRGGPVRSDHSEQRQPPRPARHGRVAGKHGCEKRAEADVHRDHQGPPPVAGLGRLAQLKREDVAVWLGICTGRFLGRTPIHGLAKRPEWLTGDDGHDRQVEELADAEARSTTGLKSPRSM